MKKTFWFFITTFLFSCVSQNDVVFSAIDELHYLKLYNKNKAFEILHNGLNTEKGQYSLKGDTIYLTYFSAQANRVLPGSVKIDRAANKIRSVGGQNFCADIAIDHLKGN